MSSKLLLASAIMAAGSFMFVETADAQRRGGAERGGDGTVEAGNRRGGARQNRGNRQAGQRQGKRRTAQTNSSRRNANTTSNRAPRANTRQANRASDRNLLPRAQFGRKDRGLSKRNPFARGWRAARRYAARRWYAPPPVYRNRCVAVARGYGGEGPRVRGISGEGFGRRACRKALNRCDARLARRQASGRNPYARCVVAGR